MKKIKFGLLSLVVALGIASCNQNDYVYTPAEALENEQVAFPLSTPTSYILTANEPEIDMLLTRQVVDDELTVNINAEGEVKSEDGSVEYFSIPEKVTFAKGQGSAKLHIVANLDAIGFDNTKNVKVSIADDSYTTPYGFAAVDMTISYPSPWKSLGKGKFKEDFMDGTGTYYDVEIQQNEIDENYYRLVKPYHAVANGEGDYEVSADVVQYLELKVRKDEFESYDFVYFPYYSTGYFHSTYGEDIYAVSPYQFKSLATEDGCKFNKVVEYQENGLPGEIELAPYYYLFEVGGGWNYTTKEGTIDILFPGFAKADYSVEVEHYGILTAADETVYAVSNVTLGADAADVKAVVYTQEYDAKTIAEAIADGALEATSVEGGRIEVPFDPEALGSSDLQTVVVVLNEGVVKNFASARFEYYGGKNPWQSLGKGIWIDAMVMNTYFQEGLMPQYEVEVQENTEKPGLYKFMNPYAMSTFPYAAALEENGLAAQPEGAGIVVDATDPEGVQIAYQSLGMNWGDGEMFFYTAGYDYYSYYGPDYYDLLKNYGYFGSVEDGIITFPQVQYGSGESAFTVQGYFELGDSYQFKVGAGSEDFMLALPGAVTDSRRKAAQFAANMAKYKAPSKRRTSAKPVSRKKAMHSFLIEHGMKNASEAPMIEK